MIDTSYAMLFDFDGTLMDTERAIVESFREIFRRYRTEEEFTKELQVEVLGPSLSTSMKKYFPNVAFTTDIIAGFPGETDDDYEKLYAFVDKMRFARLGVFAYSQEENTPAGEMENQIDEDVKEERLDGIMRRQLDISLELNKEKIGQTLEVLVEEQDEDGSWLGRSRYDAPEIDNSVIFTSNRSLKPGDIVSVRINDAFDYDLVGVEV